MVKVGVLVGVEAQEVVAVSDTKCHHSACIPIRLSGSKNNLALQTGTDHCYIRTRSTFPTGMAAGNGAVGMEAVEEGAVGMEAIQEGPGGLEAEGGQTVAADSRVMVVEGWAVVAGGQGKVEAAVAVAKGAEMANI